jgi:ABC-type sugar transport system ATPase subunit
LADNNYIIKANNITKYYGAVKALDNVDFELKQGEILGLVGDNGAGKSTLIKVLSGAVQANSGTIEVMGEQVSIHRPRDAFNLGIETIYQDLALFNNLNFTQNIFAGREYIGRYIKKVLGFADTKRMENEALLKVKDISINLPTLEQTVGTLSGGQRQAVAISRAIFWGKKIIIMDEPTAALGVEESRKVLELIKETINHVLGIILIAHNIEHVIKVANRVIILRTGQRVASLDFKDYKDRLNDLHNDIVKGITGVL